MATPHQVHDLVFNSEKEKAIHPERWQQPLGEARYYVRALSRPGDLIVDIFAGVGTSAVAVAQVGQGRRYIGCDINPICVQKVRSRVADFTTEPGSAVPLGQSRVGEPTGGTPSPRAELGGGAGGLLGGERGRE